MAQRITLMTLTLKRCPFCGGKAELRHVLSYYDQKRGKHLGCFVICSECLTSSDNYNNEENAVRHWNNRVKSD